MSKVTKAQLNCIDVCHKATVQGDRVSVHMLEYLTSVKELPQSSDDLAHGFLDTCLVLFAIEAGLKECTRLGQVFPNELLSELDKKFRVTQADFTMLDSLLLKSLEHERKGAMGRMRRGWGKMFGDDGIERMNQALARTRDSLKMSALLFQWSVGDEKIDSGKGIGFTGLAAALDRLDQKSGHVGSNKAPSVTVTPLTPPSTSPTAQTMSLASPNSSRTMEPAIPGFHHQPPLPPLPPSWAERTSSFQNPSLVDIRETHVHDHRGTMISSGSGERVHSATTAYTSDHHSLDDNLSHADTVESETFLEEIAGIDLSSGNKAIRVKADTFSQPRWVPRNNTGSDAGALRGSLAAAIRAKNHKMVEQLLDRGVSPRAGPEFHGLKEAILLHDSETLRLLLLFGADPNEVDRHGLSPLALCVEKNFIAGANLLLKYGGDPNQSGGVDVETPLGAAVIANKVNLTHLLLVYGGDANQLTSSGDTLCIAGTNKKTPKKLIDLLLEYGANPNDKSREGKTALFEAIQSSRVDIVTALLEAKANPNLPGPKHMLWPATYHSPCLKVLLAHGADFKKTPGIMELASSINNIESIRILLKAGVDPNARKDGVYTPLCTSIRDNRSDIFHLLLSNGADPNFPASEYPCFKCITHDRVHFLPHLLAAGGDLKSPKGIIETAVSCNNMEALIWLLDQGLDPNEKSPKGHSPLTTAIRENNTEMVELLLSRGADPNKRGQDWPVCMAVRNPALLERVLSVLAEPRAYKGVMEMAVSANQLDSVKLLLAAGVSVEDKNGGVFSPLTTAIREDRKEIVTYLLDEAGADINAPGEHLPIVKSVRRYNGDAEIMEILLDHGADPNKMYRGWNAMFQAVENGDLDVVKLLVEKGGVDINVKDELGRTVTEMAASRGWDDAVNVFLDAKVGRVK
jgi:ankyrin repeat protein